tara:strand:- start:1674 stop:2057 length:384 start_codon:yes stop_codon:yes gene_type:complete
MIENLLNRLEKVKEKKANQWVACCPAHSDTTPSLAIAQTLDGRILLKCWSGCSALDVISAVGLDWSALFPPKDNYKSIMDHLKNKKPNVDDYVVAAYQSDQGNSKKVSQQDKERYRKALTNLSKINT